MALYILHSDNQVFLQQRLRSITDQFDPGAVTRISLKSSASFDQLLLGINTPSFFYQKRLVVFEDGDEKKIELERIKDDKERDIVIVFNKELSATSAFLKSAVLQKAKIIGLSQPQDRRIFGFLDRLAEGNKKALEYFDSLVSELGWMYILTMMLFLVRRLVLPTEGMAPFIIKKLDIQKKRFSQKQLEALYRAILETEFLIKSGKVEERTALLLLVEKFF